MTNRQKLRKAKDALLSVAIKYGKSMTEISAEEHEPKDRPFRMSIARAYVAYRRALEQCE